MTKTGTNKKEGLTLIAAFGGGMAGFVVHTCIIMLSAQDMTYLYGFAIFIGVITGLLWDIASKLNQR